MTRLAVLAVVVVLAACTGTTGDVTPSTAPGVQPVVVTIERSQ